MLKGLLFIGQVLGIKVAIEHTTFGEQLHSMGYELLQLQLSAESVSITVVDISDLEPEKFDVDGQVDTATPREPLRKITEAITEHQPKAIGVDIDFSPEQGDYIHPQDPEFFQFCLDMQKQRGVAIFLGVKRAAAKPPQEWLGDERYQELAANILIPRDSRRMLSEINVEGEGLNGVPAKVSQPGKSMSVALAVGYGRGRADPPLGVRQIRESILGGLQRIGFVEKVSEKRLGPGLTVKEFLVDFSPLRIIEPLQTINPMVLRDRSQHERFQGKIVLLGNASRATDTFDVPTNGQPYPGVILHACAAYSLIEKPLYSVTGKGRLSINIIFLLSILFAITAIRLFYQKQASGEVATDRLQGLFTLFVVSVAFVVGFMSVCLTRVMWDDFFLALFALVFHPAIERHLEYLWKLLRKYVPAIFQRIVFKRDGEPSA